MYSYFCWVLGDWVFGWEEWNDYLLLQTGDLMMAGQRAPLSCPPSKALLRLTSHNLRWNPWAGWEGTRISPFEIHQINDHQQIAESHRNSASRPSGTLLVSMKTLNLCFFEGKDVQLKYFLEIKKSHTHTHTSDYRGFTYGTFLTSFRDTTLTTVNWVGELVEAFHLHASLGLEAWVGWGHSKDVGTDTWFIDL